MSFFSYGSGMRISIRMKNLGMTQPLRTYVQSKIVKTVDRLLKRAAGSELPILDIEIERPSAHHRKGNVYRIGVNIAVGRQMFRAEVEDENVRAAIDLVSEEIESEITRFKSRRAALFKRGARIAKKTIRFDPAARKYRKGRIRNEGN